MLGLESYSNIFPWGIKKKRGAMCRTAKTAGDLLIRDKSGTCREINYQALKQAKKGAARHRTAPLNLYKRNEDQMVKPLAVVYQKQFEVTLLPCHRSGTEI